MKAQKYHRRCAEFCMRSLHCFGVVAGNMLRYFCLAELRKVLAHLRQYILCERGSNGYFCRNRAWEKRFDKKTVKMENLSNGKSGEISPPYLVLFVFVGELPADAEFVGDDAVKPAPGRFDGFHLHLSALT